MLHDIGKIAKKSVIIDKKTGNPRVVFYNHEDLSAELAYKILNRLRYSNDMMKQVIHLIKLHMFEYTKKWSDAAIRRFIRKVGVENIENLFLLRKADRLANGNKLGIDRKLLGLKKRIDFELNKKVVLQVKDLEVDGTDVMNILKIPSGPKVGETLNRLLEIVLENPECNKKGFLRKKIVEYGIE